MLGSSIQISPSGFSGTLSGDLTLPSAGSLISAGTILVKPSGDTDDYLTFATVSNIPSIYGTGSYVRIGDAAATSNSLASEDDLMVSGKLEVDGNSYFDSQYNYFKNNTAEIRLGGAQSLWMRAEAGDGNARCFSFGFDTGANQVPALIFSLDAATAVDWGLFDGITQPLIAIVEKAHQLHSATDGIADAGVATAILKKTAGFTNAVIGDIVRITAGTLCTAGWYWITTVTSADQVTLDRNYTSGDTTNVTFVTFHNFPMIGADGVCLKCFDGAPGDANVEIDRDGWLQLDVGNNLVYARSNATWFPLATTTNDGTVTSLKGTVGDYWRIGDAAATSHSLASEDDLMISGQLEVKGSAFFDAANIDSLANYNLKTTNKGITFDLGYFGLRDNAQDANAIMLECFLPAGSGTVIPLLSIINTDAADSDLGLFDGITQPTVVVLEKANRLHSATNGIADAGAASAILKHVGGFTAAVVGDIVRITAGTLCTAGWYWITTVTSANEVVLDRNYTSGNTTDVTFVTFHNFPMIGADGVCLKCFDGAPGDANVEIDRDGWLMLDVGQANGRLYWRANNAWHYVDATA